MNMFVIALLPLLAAANAGIYSAKWPEGEVEAQLILRSGHIGLQGVDSATHNPAYVPQLRTDLVEDHSDLEANKEKDSSKPQLPNNEKENAEGERDPDQVDRAQVGLRSDMPEYVSIGSMRNHPPNAWQTWRYQPKRVRSVIIEGTDAQPAGVVESPEAPASTARTPDLNNLEPKPAAIEASPDNLDPKPAAIEETPEASVSTSKPLENAEPIADQKQLRYGYLIPTYNYYGNYPAPIYQSAAAVAQNAPGINYAASSADSQGLGNGAAISQAANYGGFQSALSSANNNQGSAIAAAQNDGRQSLSVAQSINNRGRIRYIAPQYQSTSAFANNYRS